LSKEFDIYIESGMRRMKQIRDYKEIAKRVKDLAEEIIGRVDVYVFGSVIEGRTVASSDIDILIIADNINREDAYKLKAKIYKLIDAPIELHIASTKEFEGWYKRFIKRMKRIEP